MNNIISFCLGILFTLVCITFFLKLQINKMVYSIKEVQKIKNDLQLLCAQSLSVSEKIVSELEEKINYGKKVISLMEQKEKKLEFVKTKSNFIENNNIKPIKKDILQGLSPLHKSVIQMAENGYCLRDISHKLQIEQDQAAMILQLYKEA